MRSGWILGLALTVPLTACGGGPAAPTTGELAADASQVTYDLNLKLTQEGVLKADLFADTAVQRPGETKTDLKNVRLTFFNPGRPPGKMTSRTGEYDQVTGAMTARGKVVLIVPGEGKGMRTITSEELHWDQRGDRIWSTVYTRIVEEGRTMHTEGFTSNTAFTNVQGTNARVEGVQVSGGTAF